MWVEVLYSMSLLYNNTFAVIRVRDSIDTSYYLEDCL